MDAKPFLPHDTIKPPQAVLNQMVFLQGKRIYLRPLNLADLEGPYPSWINNREVCAGNGHHYFPYSLEDARAYIKNSLGRKDQIVLAILTEAEHKHIGNIALQKINWIHRSAELAILIGDQDAWGQGYGYEASMLLLEHAFQALNLNRVACGTFSNNTGMQKLAASLGMQQEGVRCQAIYKEGMWLDIIEYGLLQKEFSERLQF